MSGDRGYDTSDDMMKNILRLPFYTYPIGMLSQSARYSSSSYTGNFNSG